MRLSLSTRSGRGQKLRDTRINNETHSDLVPNLQDLSCHLYFIEARLQTHFDIARYSTRPYNTKFDFHLTIYKRQCHCPSY